jgi:hypothetical protein
MKTDQQTKGAREAVPRQRVNTTFVGQILRTMNKIRLILMLICGIAASSLAQSDGTIYDPETGDISFIQPGGTIYDPETGDISFSSPVASSLTRRLGTLALSSRMAPSMTRRVATLALSSHEIHH